ncbi:MAG: hypothetical protein ACOH2H_16185 [Cypionkella sp.]
MSDLPVPTAGGSYLRDDTTGELTRLSGPVDEIAPANPPDVPQEAPVEIPPDVPPMTEEQ